MIEAFGTDFALLGPFGEDSEEALAKLKRAINPRTARRLSSMAILLSGLLRELPHRSPEPVFFGTSHADAPGLEKYLDTLPAASPLLFQNSIHPGPLIQAFVMLGSPVPCLFPFAGKEDLLFNTLLAALISEEEGRLCLFAEMRASWMTDAGIADDRTFAMGLRLRGSPDNARFRLALDASPPASRAGLESADPNETHAFFEALQHERGFTRHNPVYGSLTLDWI